MFSGKLAAFGSGTAIHIPSCGSGGSCDRPHRAWPTTHGDFRLDRPLAPCFRWWHCFSGVSHADEQFGGSRNWKHLRRWPNRLRKREAAGSIPRLSAARCDSLLWADSSAEASKQRDGNLPPICGRRHAVASWIHHTGCLPVREVAQRSSGRGGPGGESVALEKKPSTGARLPVARAGAAFDNGPGKHFQPG